MAWERLLPIANNLYFSLKEVIFAKRLTKIISKMKRLTSIIALLLVSSAAMAYTPNKIVVPNVDGYVTLKGDFHIHTVFSDASVWPTTRVQEAAWEGLDVIAITDHLDTRHQKMRKRGYFTEKCDRDTSYKLAKSVAAKNDVIVIHGGEITRGMPPGHFNCLFVKDNDDICAAAEKNDHDHVLAMEGGLREARKQGALLMWNHPNWSKHAPNETIMWPAHKKILKEGLMDAIEIYNAETGYSPESHEWCLKHNLAIMGCSDTHAPFFTKVDYKGGQHRIVTLLLAKERSAEGVREAIESRRTAVLGDGVVYGREQELLPLFHACVKVKNVKFSPKQVSFTLENTSSIPIRLEKAPGSEKYRYDRQVYLAPHSTYTLKVSLVQVNNKNVLMDENTKNIEVNFSSESFQIGADKALPVTFNVAW